MHHKIALIGLQNVVRFGLMCFHVEVFDKQSYKLCIPNYFM